MPALEVGFAPPTEAPETPQVQPTPAVVDIVDKTASFVARNGPEFEARIRDNEQGNPKFNFLNFGDPYHAYYQHKVKDIREGKGQDQSGTVPPGTAPPSKTVASVKEKQQELLKSAIEQPFIPKDPPPELEFVADPPSISALDLDIVKLTAQFVALNGRTFLTNLMNREQRNFQFDFLRPQHSLFQYFTKLLEQYTKVLIPPKDMMFRLKDECSTTGHILEQVKYRSEWIKYQEAQKRREEEELEKERVAYAQIDWHDFVVVETVDYQPMEVGNFPPPTTPDEVGARMLMQERYDVGDEMQLSDEDEDDREERRPRVRKAPAQHVFRRDHRDRREDDNDEQQEEMQRRYKDKAESRDNIQVQDMEEGSSSEEEDDGPPGERKLPAAPPPPPPPKEAMQPPPLPPLPDRVLVKKGYDPKQAVKITRPPAPDEMLISPITGEKIPANKVQEHMRIGLLDPRWVEQRDKHIQDKMNQETVYAPGAAIEASLKQLAERRTDIFGVGDEETAIGKKIGEEDTRKDEKVTWDGHTSSVEAATRAARANITLEDQIQQIHKAKGLLPDEEKEKIGPKPIKGRERDRGVVADKGPRKAEQPKPPGTKGPEAPQPAQPGAAGVPLPPMPGMPQMAPMPGMPQGMPAGMSHAPMPMAHAPMPMAPMPSMAPMPPGGPGMPPGMPPSMMMMPGMAPRPMMVQQGPYSVPQPGGPMQRFLPPGAPQPAQPPMPHMARPSESVEDEPPSKKSRNEDNLIPEQEFLSKHKAPVTIKVQVPTSSDKPEWRLNGQMLSLVLPLTESFAAVKSRIQDETGLPPAKQKLQYEGMFFKDSNTLAFYNMMSGAIVQLQLKERGGRKK
ncbi:hypothetical protein FOCC_FOCC004381 [Frankliniella occidentalis]|nr:hypothetical protein FOCC_FOCC004381 [Frankliniella occidentalis]